MNIKTGFDANGYAIEIEAILCELFNCERWGFGGQISSNKIIEHPFLSITQGLAIVYAIKNEKRNDIDKFINNFSIYSDMTIEDIINLKAKENIFKGISILIHKNNGIEEIEYMINLFKSLSK